MVRINSISFGEIVIDGKTYYSDMIIWWDGKLEYRGKSHTLNIEEFMELMKRNPEIIIIGKGHEKLGMLKASDSVKELAEQKKIPIYTEHSEKAIEIFNAFISDGKRAVVVIHTTT